MNFSGKLTVAVAIFILAMASTLTQDAPSCGMGCSKHEICVAEEGNPAQAHCRKFRVCPLNPDICPLCIVNDTCISVGDKCHHTQTFCIPNKDLHV